MPQPEFAYDVVAYPSHPLPQTHPEHSAAIGTLLGMSPAPVERCRVLELGGGDGINLIPLGLIYPKSTFVSLDLAATAVAKGNETIASLGINNVTLRVADLLDLPRDLGEFDYIIAHGLFSWVPPIVREKVLSICREHLAPQGIAYVSYNTFPGCHIRNVLRDMMRYHTRNVEEPAAKIEQAVAFAHFLAAAKANDPAPYSQVLRDELKGMIDQRDRAVLFHDDLADINQPFYFREFMARAAAHDLQFLAEAEFFMSSDRAYPQEVAHTLRELGDHDVQEREQYLDFLKLRRFRQTLLVRNEVALYRRPAPERVKSLSISTRAKPDSAEVNLQPGVKVKFHEASGAALTFDLPVAKAAFVRLSNASPLPIAFPALVSDVEATLARKATTDEVDALLSILHTAFTVGLVELHAGPATFLREPSLRPKASPLVRLQLTQGEMTVASLRHTPIHIENALTRQLLLLLDGTRDRAAILEGILAWAVANPPPDHPRISEAQLRENFAAAIEPGLQAVAAMGLLID